MSVPEGFTIVTNLSETLTVSAATLGVPTAMLTCTPGVQYAVLAEVLSNTILYEIDDPTADPDHNSKKAAVGDLIFVHPARNLRMRRDGTDACVHVQAFQR